MALTVMLAVVAPVLHKTVFVPVPPLGVAVSVIDESVLQATVVIDTVGFGFTVRVPEQLVVQPFESVTKAL